MSLPNPYQSPETVAHRAPTLIDNGTTLMWYAGTVAAMGYVFGIYFEWSRGVFDLNEAFIRAILYSATLAIPALVIYAFARRVYRLKYDFAPTPKSSVVVGCLAGVYSGVVLYATFAFPSSIVVWGVGALIGIPVAFALCYVERAIAGPPDTTHHERPLVNETRSQASVFWFSGTCLLVGTMISVVMQPSTTLSFTLIGAVIGGAISAMFCTVAYGLASLCVRRARPATRISRVVAGVAFTAAIWGANVVMEQLQVPPGLPRILSIFVIAPFCVVIDRLLSDPAVSAE